MTTRLNALFACILFLAAGAVNAAVELVAGPGLVVHYYGEPTFWFLTSTDLGADLPRSLSRCNRGGTKCW